METSGPQDLLTHSSRDVCLPFLVGTYLYSIFSNVYEVAEATLVMHHHIVRFDFKTKLLGAWMFLQDFSDFLRGKNIEKVFKKKKNFVK